jgi:hypothetical protein
VLAIALKVDEFLDTLLPENVMTTSRALVELEMDEEVTQIIERDVCVRLTF